MAVIVNSGRSLFHQSEVRTTESAALEMSNHFLLILVNSLILKAAFYIDSSTF